MSNERIINDGIITPRIYLGNQGSSGAITYDSTTGTITINANLNIVGSSTQVESSNTSITDNVITLNSGQTGSGISSGFSGIEVYRGTGKKISFTLIDVGDTTSYWVANNEDGIGIRIKSSVAPTDSDDLVNKSYVDALVHGSSSGLTLNSSLGDVQVSNLSDGQMIQWNGAINKWQNVARPPDGLTSVTLTATGGLVSQRKTGASTWASDTTTANGPYTDSTSTILKASPYQELRVNLADQVVTPGAYRNANITVNQKGIITAVSSNNLFQTFRAAAGSGGSTDDGLTTPSNPSDQFSIVAGTGLASSVVSTVYGSGQGIQLALRNTGVSAGSYANANITVDATGRITAASAGSAGGWTSIKPDTGGVLNSSNSQLQFEGGYGLSSYKVNDNYLGITLDRNIITAGTYVTPTVTVDDAGRVTGISANSVQNGIWTNNGTAYASGLSQIGVVGGNGGITTRVVGNIVYVDNAGGISGQSVASNGYITFSNGLMMQWGVYNYVSPTGTSGTNSVGTKYATPFNVNFSGPAYSVTLTRIDNGYGGYNQKHINLDINGNITTTYVYNPSLGYSVPTTVDNRKSGFAWWIQDDDSGNSGCYIYGFCWMAMGPA